MRIKRYLVKEMQEAVRLIKQDLGSDALIVSSYKVPARGLIGLFSPRLLEVTAVLDDSPEVQLNVGCPPAQMAVAEVAEKPYIKYFDSQWPVIEEMDEPERGGAGYFEKMVEGRVAAALNKGCGCGWRRRLLDMDIGADIVEYLISAVDAGREQPDGQMIYFSLLKQVKDLLEPAYRAVGKPRILTFMGPPGVGKTTCLAKLATRFKIFSNKRITLVGVGRYRIGGFDQLQAYGDFLDVPVEMAMTPVELAKILEKHEDQDYILIDTDGRSPWGAGQVLELKNFLDVCGEPQGNFLVLSASSKDRDLVKTAGEFRRVGFAGYIFTRVDETETHGSILNLPLKTGVPVVYLANGQKIPDDITEANPKVIAKLLFRGVDPGETMALRDRPNASSRQCN